MNTNPDKEYGAGGHELIHLRQGFLLRPELRDYGEQVGGPVEVIQNRGDLSHKCP